MNADNIEKEKYWELLKEKIYFRDGSLRDIYVFNVTKEDWEKWAEFVNKNYEVKFFTNDSKSEEQKINLEKVKEYFSIVRETAQSASIFIGNIVINAFFFLDDEIENDINPKEINSLEDHNNLMNYLKGISKALKKEVILTKECYGDKEILVSVNSDEITISL